MGVNKPLPSSIELSKKQTFILSFGDEEERLNQLDLIGYYQSNEDDGNETILIFPFIKGKTYIVIRECSEMLENSNLSVSGQMYYEKGLLGAYLKAPKDAEFAVLEHNGQTPTVLINRINGCKYKRCEIRNSQAQWSNHIFGGVFQCKKALKHVDLLIIRRLLADNLPQKQAFFDIVHIEQKENSPPSIRQFFGKETTNAHIVSLDGSYLYKLKREKEVNLVNQFGDEYILQELIPIPE